jgi:hypothetical protein
VKGTNSIFARQRPARETAGWSWRRSLFVVTSTITLILGRDALGQPFTQRA